MASSAGLPLPRHHPQWAGRAALPQPPSFSLKITLYDWSPEVSLFFKVSSLSHQRIPSLKLYLEQKYQTITRKHYLKNKGSDILGETEQATELECKYPTTGCWDVSFLYSHFLSQQLSVSSWLVQTRAQNLWVSAKVLLFLLPLTPVFLLPPCHKPALKRLSHLCYS